MSTILKALRRLEEDRRNEDERSLRDRILSQETPGVGSAGGRGVLVPVLGSVGIFALLAAGGAAWWVLARGPEASSDGLAQGAPRVLQEDLRADAAEVAPTALAAVSAPPPAVSSPPARVPPPAVVPVEPSPGIAEDIGLVTRPPKRPIAAPPPQMARAAAPPPVPEVAAPLAKPQSTPGPKPAPALGTRAVEAPAVRKIERSPMPEFVVTRTVWHPEAGRRLAMIRQSGQSGATAFGEGEAMGVLEIVEIQPAAVLFRRDGVEIKRRVGR